jgi:hypothetical protein
VIRRGATTCTVKAIPEFGQDNPETDGNEIDTDVLIAVVECLPVRLRKMGGAGLSTFRAIEAFGPMVPPGHSPNMRLRQAPSLAVVIAIVAVVFGRTQCSGTLLFCSMLFLPPVCVFVHRGSVGFAVRNADQFIGSWLPHLTGPRCGSLFRVLR